MLYLCNDLMQDLTSLPLEQAPHHIHAAVMDTNAVLKAGPQEYQVHMHCSWACLRTSLLSAVECSCKMTQDL